MDPVSLLTFGHCADGYVVHVDGGLRRRERIGPVADVPLVDVVLVRDDSGLFEEQRSVLIERVFARHATRTQKAKFDVKPRSDRHGGRRAAPRQIQL
jgi:hypothetical protein